MSNVNTVLATVNDPTRQLSGQTKVLRALIKAEHDNEWLTLGEIGVRVGISASTAGSRLRDLRVHGFNIKRAKRRQLSLLAPKDDTQVWEYKLFSPAA